MTTLTELKYQPFGRAVAVAPDVARVTFKTRRRSIAPGIVRARVELAGHFDISGARMTTPQIVAQSADGAWMTWEARALRPDEPDTAR